MFRCRALERFYLHIILTSLPTGHEPNRQVQTPPAPPVVVVGVSLRWPEDPEGHPIHKTDKGMDVILGFDRKNGL